MAILDVSDLYSFRKAQLEGFSQLVELNKRKWYGHSCFMKKENVATESQTILNNNGSRLLMHPSGQWEVQLRHIYLTFDPAPVSAGFIQNTYIRSKYLHADIFIGYPLKIPTVVSI